MDIEQLDAISKQNNDQDVLNTNVYQIANNTFVVQERLSDLTREMDSTTDYQNEFIQKTYDLKDSVQDVLITYNNYVGQFNQVISDDVIEQIGTFPNQITYVKNLIQYINACIDILRYNNEALYSTSTTDFPINPDNPTPDSKVYANIINHNDVNIGMQYAAKRFYDLITDSNKNYIDSGSIKWNNWYKSADRLTSAKLKSAILEQILKVPEDGLYIFWYGGHGGDKGTKQYLALPDSNNIYDNELWSMFKKCKGRILAIFNCCHAGTMYRDIQIDVETGEQIFDEQQNIRPFGSNWFGSEMTARTTYTDDAPSPSQFTNSDPVYVHLTKDVDDVKILCFSASHQDQWEIGIRTTGSLFNTAMCDVWDSHNSDDSYTYKKLFDATYPNHRAAVDAAKEKNPSGRGYVVGTAMCTYTDGFKPDEYTMFR